MFLIGLTVGMLTGGGMAIFGMILAYRLAQIHNAEEQE